MDKIPGSGCLLLGDNGTLFSDNDYGAQFFIKLKGEKDMRDGKTHEAVKAIPQSIPRNAFQGGGDERQHLEWIAACKGGPGRLLGFRHCGVPDGNHSAGVCRVARGQEAGMGWPEHAGAERARGRAIRSPREPAWLELLVATTMHAEAGCQH